MFVPFRMETKIIYKQNITYKAVVSIRPSKDMQGCSTTGYGENNARYSA